MKWLYLLRYLYKKFMQMINLKKIFILVSMMLFVITCILSACDIGVSVKKNEETESIFIPEAANQFAVDKETETEAIEETKAHHIYPEDFKMVVDKEVVIGEKNFLTKIDYIYKHIDDFANSSIIVEGMYAPYTSWDETFEFPMVYRNGPSCCGDDQHSGFYLVNIDQNAFEIDDWIEVKGRPFMYEHTDSEGETFKYLFLLVEEIKKLPLKDRKAEMVNN